MQHTFCACIDTLLVELPSSLHSCVLVFSHVCHWMVVWWWSLMKVVTLTGGVMLPVVMLKDHATLMNLPVSVYPISH